MVMDLEKQIVLRANRLIRVIKFKSPKCVHFPSEPSILVFQNIVKKLIMIIDQMLYDRQMIFIMQDM